MALHKRMERGAVAGRRAGNEVRIGRCAVTGVHCQEYDANGGETVDRTVYCLDAFLTFQLF